jgi:hypothetical protein
MFLTSQSYPQRVTRRTSQSTRASVFPIAEVFGLPYEGVVPATEQEHEERECPFSAVPCEKFRQYQLSTCSAWYAADGDDGVQKRYAICDHRLDGDPVQWAVSDYFGSQPTILIPEVTVARKPSKLCVDYFAFDSTRTKVIAIETQAIDTRGGSLRPAWDAWLSGEPSSWRSYYTAAAKSRKRRDSVSFGINTSNVRKRLGTQIAEKCEVLARLQLPMYVIMQNSILERLRSVIEFQPTGDGEPWDITFAGFDFDGTLREGGQLELQRITTARTTYERFADALIRGAWQDVQREEVIERALQKHDRKLRTPRAKEDVDQLSLEY